MSLRGGNTSISISDDHLVNIILSIWIHLPSLFFFAGSDFFTVGRAGGTVFFAGSFALLIRSIHGVQ